MKKATLKMVLGLSSLFIYSYTSAACTFSDTGAGMIRIQPTTGSTSTLQIRVKCDTDFNIQFNSQNLMNNSGQSLLKNDEAGRYTKLKNSIPVKYDLTGNAGSQWQVSQQQHKNAQHQYVIIARLGVVNLANLVAGDYKDQINIDIDY